MVHIGVHAAEAADVDKLGVSAHAGYRCLPTSLLSVPLCGHAGYLSALVGYGPELGCTLLELRQQHLGSRSRLRELASRA